jgi:hypothetical protein
MTLEVENSNTIDELKSQIFYNLHVPVEQLRLESVDVYKILSTPQFEKYSTWRALLGIET